MIWDRESAREFANRIGTGPLHRHNRTEREELLWLVRRVQGIRNATRWTKAERERSWADWEARAMALLSKIAD